MPGIAVLLKNELPFSFYYLKNIMAATLQKLGQGCNFLFLYSKNIMPGKRKIKILIKSKRLRDMAEAGKFIRED